MLRSIVAYVNNYGVWVAELHGLPNIMTSPPGGVFVPSTKLSHVLLLCPALDAQEMYTAEVVQGDTSTIVNFYLVLPLTTAEAQWKRDKGFNASLAYIIGNKQEATEDDSVLIDFIIDPLRPCAVDDLHCLEGFDAPMTEEEEDASQAQEQEEEDAQDAKPVDVSEE